ncbi:hypothetical protein TNCV_157961 [Trichonephila clavipes]|nr:hypothetical protein TNCV_157961 [Trichonephila clavipes]
MLPLDLGLRRHFWRFVIADVPLPIIGSDFLAHFGLLPETFMLSIKTISGESTPYDHILKEYPALQAYLATFLILLFIIYEQLRVLQSLAVLDQHLLDTRPGH